MKRSLFPLLSILALSLAAYGQQALLKFDVWWPYSNVPFADGAAQPNGFPAAPEKRYGVWVTITNCPGCVKYIIRVKYEVNSTAGWVGKQVEIEKGADAYHYTNEIVWLGKSRTDHRVTGVEVEALSVSARAAQQVKQQ